MKKICVLWCFCFFYIAFSQEKKLYFDKHNQITSNQDSAYYVRKYLYNENQKVWNVVDKFRNVYYRKGNSTSDPAIGITGYFAYFNRNKEKYLAGNFKNNKKTGEWTGFKTSRFLQSSKSYYDDYGNKTGNWKTWYEDGTLADDEFYKNDSLQGECKYYYKNGQLSADEVYEKGKLISYKLFDEDGKPMEDENYKPKISASFKGADTSKKLANFISKQLEYPEQELWAGIQGQVRVAFSVSPEGKVQDIDIVKSVTPNIDKEVSEVLLLTNGKWKPAWSHNRKVTSYYFLPVTFHFQSKKSK